MFWSNYLLNQANVTSIYPVAGVNRTMQGIIRALHPKEAEERATVRIARMAQQKGGRYNHTRAGSVNFLVLSCLSLASTLFLLTVSLTIPTPYSQQLTNLCLCPEEEVRVGAINVAVHDDITGAEIHFKMQCATMFYKVFDAYCMKLAVGRGTRKFLFIGDRVQNEATPNSMGMPDGAVIHAVVCGQLG